MSKTKNKIMHFTLVKELILKTYFQVANLELLLIFPG